MPRKGSRSAPSKNHGVVCSAHENIPVPEMPTGASAIKSASPREKRTRKRKAAAESSV